MTTTVPALAQDIGLARQADYFLMKDQLTEDEPGLLHRVRKFAETEVLPVVNLAGAGRDLFSPSLIEAVFPTQPTRADAP